MKLGAGRFEAPTEVEVENISGFDVCMLLVLVSVLEVDFCSRLVFSPHNHNHNACVQAYAYLLCKSRCPPPRSSAKRAALLAPVQAIAAMLRVAGGPCEVILSDDDGWETVSDGEDDDEE
jgi:hypothetical protein